MKNITKTVVASLIVAGILVTMGVQSTLAFGGNLGGGKNMRIESGSEGKEGLVPSEIRENFRVNSQNFTSEEKVQFRQERQKNNQNMREEKRAQMEEFTGLSRDEMQTACQEGSIGKILTDQGITEDEAEEFLTESANERVDDIVERHNMSAEDEQTLRDRIVDFVERILDRWFN
ncbi:MAG: hypothetical protein KAS07_03955 [Candidatus Pacebacteria bacterium]|nr:hypothetical protein [Candidatus Paceibacterota bacterium]